MYDAVIVLANLMDENGILNDETIARVSVGNDLFQAGAAPVIALCGWAYRDDSDICIADAMVTHAERAFGIPRSKMLTEPRSRDTVGDAVFTKRYLAEPKGWQNIVVVTSAYHAQRACEIFSFVYGRDIDVVSADSDNTLSLQTSEAKSKAVFWATFDGVSAGDDTAIFERLITRHPFYNGDVYSKFADGDF